MAPAEQQAEGGQGQPVAEGATSPALALVKPDTRRQRWEALADKLQEQMDVAEGQKDISLRMNVKVTMQRAESADVEGYQAFTLKVPVWSRVPNANSVWSSFFKKPMEAFGEVKFPTQPMVSEGSNSAPLKTLNITMLLPTKGEAVDGVAYPQWAAQVLAETLNAYREEGKVASTVASGGVEPARTRVVDTAPAVIAHDPDYTAAYERWLHHGAFEIGGRVFHEEALPYQFLAQDVAKAMQGQISSARCAGLVRRQIMRIDDDGKGTFGLTFTYDRPVTERQVDAINAAISARLARAGLVFPGVDGNSPNPAFSLSQSDSRNLTLRVRMPSAEMANVFEGGFRIGLHLPSAGPALRDARQEPTPDTDRPPAKPTARRGDDGDDHRPIGEILGMVRAAGGKRRATTGRGDVDPADLDDDAPDAGDEPAGKGGEDAGAEAKPTREPREPRAPRPPRAASGGAPKSGQGQAIADALSQVLTQIGVKLTGLSVTHVKPRATFMATLSDPAKAHDVAVAMNAKSAAIFAGTDLLGEVNPPFSATQDGRVVMALHMEDGRAKRWIEAGIRGLMDSAVPDGMAGDGSHQGTLGAGKGMGKGADGDSGGFTETVMLEQANALGRHLRQVLADTRLISEKKLGEADVRPLRDDEKVGDAANATHRIHITTTLFNAEKKAALADAFDKAKAGAKGDVLVGAHYHYGDVYLYLNCPNEVRAQEVLKGFLERAVKDQTLGKV